MFRWLFIGFLAELWLSLEAVQRENPNMCEYPRLFCYDRPTNSSKTCFRPTTFHLRSSHQVKSRSASPRCNITSGSSSVVIIKDIQSQRNVEILTARHVFTNGTIIMDPQMFAANVGFEWPLFNDHQAMQEDSKPTPVKPAGGDKEGGSSADPNDGQSLPLCVGHVQSPHHYTCHYSAGTRSFPCDSSYMPCVCEKKKGGQKNDAEWCCNCNHSCAIVCHEDNLTPTTTIAVTTTTAPIVLTTTTYDSTIAAKGNADSTSSTTEKQSNTDTPSITLKPSNYSFSVEKPNDISLASSSPSAGKQVNSSDSYMHTFLLILLFVVVAFIIVAVVLFIRKRKSDKRNEWSPVTYTSQEVTVPNVYADVFPDNGPLEGTAPAGNHIYDDLDMMTQDPTPSNVYSEVQSTSIAVDMGRSVDYVDIDLPMKDQQKPKSTSKVPLSLSPVYSQPFEPSASNTEYAEPFKPDTTDTATAPVLSHSSAAGELQSDVYSLAKAIPLSEPNVIYSQPNKPAKSPEPTGKAGGATDPIHSEAIEVKPGAGSGGAVTQDPNAVYAEPLNLKKSS